MHESKMPTEDEYNSISSRDNYITKGQPRNKKGQVMHNDTDNLEKAEESEDSKDESNSFNDDLNHKQISKLKAKGNHKPKNHKIKINRSNSSNDNHENQLIYINDDSLENDMNTIDKAQLDANSSEIVKRARSTPNISKNTPVKHTNKKAPILSNIQEKEVFE